MRGDVRSEWDGTKQHDVLFLLTIDPPDAHELVEIRREAEAAPGEGAAPSPDKLYGLVTVRGCEVIEVSPTACLREFSNLATAKSQLLRLSLVKAFIAAAESHNRYNPGLHVARFDRL